MILSTHPGYPNASVAPGEHRVFASGDELPAALARDFSKLDIGRSSKSRLLDMTKREYSAEGRLHGDAGQRRGAAMSAGKWPLAAAICALLTGCAAFPEKSPTIALKTQSILAATQSFAATAAEWPASGWWKIYADAQLDALI